MKGLLALYEEADGVRMSFKSPFWESRIFELRDDLSF